MLDCSFSKQVEILKKVPLPPALGQTVFSGPHSSLYEWISSQVSGEEHPFILLFMLELHTLPRMTIAVSLSC